MNEKDKAASFLYFDRRPKKLRLPTLKELYEKAPHPVANDIIWSSTYFPYLHALAEYFEPTSILEVGTQHAYSIIALAKGARKANVKHLRILTVENKPERVEVAKKNWKACMAGSGIDIEFITADSTAIEIKDEPFDMAYIDGNHQFPSVYKDLQVCYPAVRSGGVVLLDDIVANTGVFKAVEKVKEEWNIKPEHVAFCPTKHGTAMIWKQ